jgi:hypothetical protein
MDAGSLLSAIVTLTLAGIGGLGWLFKLHGDQRVTRERLSGEVELRKALEARINGFEQRIYDKLEQLFELISRKADK